MTDSVPPGSPFPGPANPSTDAGAAAADALGRFLTLADVAEILAITPTEAHELVRSGELPGIRVGKPGAWRVERFKLESFIEAKYEEARRMALWQQSDFANIPELWAGHILPPDE